MLSILILISVIVLVILYILTNDSCLSNNDKQKSQENFTCSCKLRKDKKLHKYPYDPKIQTPQSNYNKIIEKINSQQTYKKDLSVALSPTPTIHCPELKNITDCNKYGCNWFGSSANSNSNSFCSSTYPTQF